MTHLEQEFPFSKSVVFVYYYNNKEKEKKEGAICYQLLPPCEKLRGLAPP